MKIGFRIPGAAREMPFDELCAWAKNAGFDSIDVGLVTDEIRNAAAAAALEIGTSDLPGVREILSEDAEKRSQGAELAREAIQAASERGVNKMFCVFMPDDVTLKRAETFELWKEHFTPIVQFAEDSGVRIAMEGWPGPGPTYPAIGCTPEMWRAMFEACPSPALGLNYDPSHLVRLGIDWARALDEFGDRVVHVHGKDTRFDCERLYEHGQLPPTFRSSKGFSESWWRYTIPGDGLVDWKQCVQTLEDFGFDGVISVELEDHYYSEGWAGQSEGLKRSRDFLATVIR